ncbi:MAG: hypothetical protein ABW217_16110 [Polyangiaceae bacterium]
MLLEIDVDSEDPAEVAAQLGYYIQGVAQSNRLIMRKERVPPLYQSGVSYRIEPWASQRQSLSNCRSVIARRWAECKSAAAYLLAERREACASEDYARKYDLQVSWDDHDAGSATVKRALGHLQLQPRNGILRVFHIVVLLPNGGTEDPSKRLPEWKP